MKSGNLNILEPSGPLQACNGTALPLPLIIIAENGSEAENVEERVADEETRL
jgi:hypothetical protein